MSNPDTTNAATTSAGRSGPLIGFRGIELPAMGPVPFAGMMLSDLGADIIRIDRASDIDRKPVDAVEKAMMSVYPLMRGRRRIALDLKDQRGLDIAYRLVQRADFLLEGFRPGAAEKLKLGPEHCRAHNKRLVYGRMTGWGQDGPLAQAAAHDINYLALTGVLDSIGHAGGPPVAPLGHVADFGGGGLFLAFGVLAAILEAQRSGLGQVVDTAIVDGAPLLGLFQRYLWSTGEMPDPRGMNALDGGSYYYGVYQTSDDRWVSVGAPEPHFHDTLLRLLGLDPKDFEQNNRAKWPEQRERVAARFRMRTQAEWQDTLEGTDACFAPVLTHRDAPSHPHNIARGTFVEVGGETQPGPAPRFDRTSPSVPRPHRNTGADGRAVLCELGFQPDEVESLIRAEIVRLPADAI